MKTSNIKSIKYIRLSHLVPKSWQWFYDLISQDAPFSWGDNNHTLVTASRLHEHAKERLEDVIEDVPQNHIDKFLNQLAELKDTYIDLES